MPSEELPLNSADPVHTDSAIVLSAEQEAKLLRDLDRCSDPRQFVSRFRITWGGDHGIDIAQLSAQGKRSLSQTTSRLLGSSFSVPDRTRLTARSPEDFLNFWRMLRLLREVDRTTFEADYQHRIPALLQQSFQSLPRRGETLDGVNRHVDMLYQIMNMRLSPDMEVSCEEEIRRLDGQMRNTAVGEVTAHCRRWLRASQDLLSPSRARVDLVQELGDHLNGNADAAGRSAPNTDERLRRSYQEWSSNPNLRRNDNGYYSFTLRLPGRKEASQWQLDIFSGDHEYVIVRSAQQDAMVAITAEDFFARMRRLGPAFFQSIAEEAIANRQREEKGSKELRQFDLPESGPLAHLRVFPRQYDPVMGVNLQSSMLLSNALRARYGERMQVRPIIFADNPRRELVQSIREAHQAGVRCFCVDIFSHGLRDRGLESFHPPMTARDLVAIANQFPDCIFNFSSLACYGAGLREGMMDELERDDLITAFENDAENRRPPLRSRINLFLQTRPTTANMTAMRERQGEQEISNAYATNYYLSFIRSLHEGSTFGEGVRRATMEMRRGTMFHPESILRGQLVSNSTHEQTSPLT